MNSRLLFVSLALLFSLSACDLNSTYEDDHDFDSGSWPMNDLISFDFVTESSVQNIDVKIRSNLDYPFYNLYLKAELLDSLGQVVNEELLGFNLYDANTGKPLGKGNSIYQRTVRAFENQELPYDGQYSLRLAHYMRVDELQGVLSVGVRVKPNED